MDRREALKRTALLMGGAISAPAIIGILKGCTPKPSIDWTPAFLTTEQGLVVEQVADIIIPKTDTPGAKEVGIPGFIDEMVKDVYSENEQQHFVAELKAFMQDAEKEYGDPFFELNAEDQLSFVKKKLKLAIDHSRSASPEPPKQFMLAMKELTMLGYFTSEAGATQVLQYVPVPGAYKGCIPLSEAGNGRTWAM